MRVLLRIEHPLDIPIECSQHADARHHGRAIEFDDQEQRFDRGLPLIEILFGLGKLLDIVRSVLEGDELAAAGKGNRIVEGARPISHDATARTGPRRRRDEGSTISVYYGHACVAVLRHMRGRRSRGQIRREQQAQSRREKGSGHSSRF